MLNVDVRGSCVRSNDVTLAALRTLCFAGRRALYSYLCSLIKMYVPRRGIRCVQSSLARISLQDYFTAMKARRKWAKRRRLVLWL